MNRPATVGQLITLAITLLIAAMTGSTTAAERPNIILLMGDDHGWDETGYNGHPHLRTPVLDEMAATGLRLDRFYSAHPSCSPTRGSVLTGRHPNRYGTFSPGYSIRPEEVTIAHLLSKAGYFCGHFGKRYMLQHATLCRTLYGVAKTPYFRDGILCCTHCLLNS